MFLSEAETEVRLDELRRQRAALDRAIAEHELYLDLGRRLARPGATEPPRPAPAPVRRPDPAPHSEPVSAEPVSAEPILAEPTLAESPRSQPGRAVPAAAPIPDPDPDPVSGPAPVRPDPAETAPESAPAGAASRREGRRLIEAAEAILAEAGRPMHAAEIWERLAARGLTLPGHDPVAALNTRLWKRAQGGGVFRRLGDAVYGLAS